MCLAPAGHAMMSSETVRKIGFTGSTAVGKLLAEQAAKVGRHVWMLAPACL
jgi:acyl-CoA reductase-like NAD-dependent aldehyde dehydrogenase